MEDLLCYGCSQYESKYIEDGKIKVCKNFAKKIWKSEKDEDLNKPSTRFDGCGLLAGEGFEELANGLEYIIPSKVFNNFEDFINALKIPYYEDYEIIVVDGDENNCFNFGSFVSKSLFTFIIFLIFI